MTLQQARRLAEIADVLDAYPLGWEEADDAPSLHLATTRGYEASVYGFGGELTVMVYGTARTFADPAAQAFDLLPDGTVRHWDEDRDAYGYPLRLAWVEREVEGRLSPTTIRLAVEEVR